MKTAKEMKKIAFENSKIGTYLETVVASKIETAAKQGEDSLRIKTDDIPSPWSRPTTTTKVQEYLKRYGYRVSSTTDEKNIDISW